MTERFLQNLLTF